MIILSGWGIFIVPNWDDAGVHGSAESIFQSVQRGTFCFSPGMSVDLTDKVPRSSAELDQGSRKHSRTRLKFEPNC